jgi:hypothetical protein
MKNPKNAFLLIIVIGLSFVQSGFNFRNAIVNNTQDERHEFVRKGNHPSEMPIADYVIIETTTSEDDAKQKSGKLQQIDNVKVGCGYQSARKMWYVYLKGATDNLDDTRALRDKVRQQEKFKNVWLMTVHS